MKLAFFGTSLISELFLRHIFAKEEVICAVTSPPRPAGRGMLPRVSEVNVFAKRNKIELFSPENFRDNDFVQLLQTLALDLGIVVSYGKIIPEKIYGIPKLGCINVHFSLLPKYRGAAPIQRALINGETSTGVSLFFINDGLDTGDLISQGSVEILSEDDAVTLQDKLVQKAKVLLDKMLLDFTSGVIKRTPQQGEPSFAPVLVKQDGKIDWHKKAAEIHNLIRGALIWPTAFTNTANGILKIFKSTETNFCYGDGIKCPAAPVDGQITGVVKNEGFIVKCGEGFLKVLEVQPENRKRMPAWDFLQSGKLKLGDLLK